MILDDTELKVFSMYVKNDLIFFRRTLTNSTSWNCRSNELNDCEDCDFAFPKHGERNRCPIVDGEELRAQLKNYFPEYFKKVV